MQYSRAMYEKFMEYLNIDKNASLEDIKRKYRIIVLKFHPDKYFKNKKKFEQFQSAFKNYNNAYNYLIENYNNYHNEYNMNLSETMHKSYKESGSHAYNNNLYYFLIYLIIFLLTSDVCSFIWDNDIMRYTVQRPKRQKIIDTIRKNDTDYSNKPKYMKPNKTNQLEMSVKIKIINAYSALNAKNYSEVNKICRDILKMSNLNNSQYAEVCNILGLAELEQNNYQTAIVYFSSATNLFKDDIYYYNLAIAFLYNLRYEDALKNLNNAISLNNQNANAYYLRFKTNSLLGNHLDASNDIKLANNLYKTQNNIKMYEETLQIIKEINQLYVYN